MQGEFTSSAERSRRLFAVATDASRTKDRIDLDALDTAVIRATNEVSDWAHWERRVATASVIPSLGSFLSAVVQSAPLNESTGEDWLQKSVEELKAARTVRDDWNGYGSRAPNSTALYWAEEILTCLWELDLKPAHISPSADDGIALAFVRPGRYADIECFNSGEILGVVSDREEEVNVWELEPGDFGDDLRRIRAYLDP